VSAENCATASPTRDLRNQSEYEGLSVDVEEVREALEHVSAIVAAIAADL